MNRRVLVIDDEQSILHTLEGILRDEGWEVALAESGEQGLEAIEGQDPDLLLLDVWLPGIDGIETLERVKGRYPDLPVVLMSGHGTIETAVRATKLGAFDFIEKPLNLDKVLLVLDNALKASRLVQENRYWRDRVGRSQNMVGQSAAMGELLEQIRVVAPTRASALITGENGTGKELVARAIHSGSKRAQGPFVEVNCAAIPEELIESELFGHEKGSFTGAAARRRGKFDLAHEGTLFLDEIGDMSLKTQAKILRVLQEMRFERVGGSRTHEVDVRVIAATNKELEGEIRAGNFREDLYFRLNVVPFVVPPLRERQDDIPRLMEHFIAQYCAEEDRAPVAVGPGVMEVLQAYPWPGNVRELKNVTERMVILCRDDVLGVDGVPQAIRSASVATVAAAGPEREETDLKEARRSFERRFIQHHLQRADGNVSHTAEAIGMDKSSLYKKIKELEIETGE